MKCSIRTTSTEETEQLAEKIGQRLRGGEVIELISDLGGGKTTFVRGLARGFGSHDRVASPTFTISREYYLAGDRISRKVVHFDFYRLQHAGLIEHELDDLLGDSDVVIVVEWAEAIHHVLPQKRLKIELKHLGETDRGISFSCPESQDYLVDGVC